MRIAPSIQTALHSRKLLVALSAVIALVVVGTTLGYTALSKSVTLTLDGKSNEVTVLGGTVEEVLASEGIEIGKYDEVAPSLDTSVSDGTAITVAFGRPLELNVDGKESTHWVTATSVGGALSQIGRRFAGADLSASRSSTIRRSGMELEVVTPKEVRLAVGAGKARKVDVPAMTVGEVLEELDVKLGKHDVVTPRPGKKIKPGDRITVKRIKIVRKNVSGEKLGFDTIQRTDASMPEGKKAVVRAGRAGLRDVVYELRYVNGKLVARKVVSSEVTRKSRDAIIKVGTKKAPAPAAPVLTSGNTVWDRLAQCESGGNWGTNTGNGYYGGLQFSASTWASVGGSGLPHQHSREEQIKRGKILQARAGWGQWPHCSAKLGLR
ncbi:resuscitation-promoting factor [Nocardioides jishulii]|uniref:DUF348 domain-containing protein n=1 Tax=Nocardioides jishulii TaxID=2575440 RepID=A0A4U2YT03_9ACTN|nr:resuscitation-promoting factor [Nocardioides jishulii]QCX28528.1 DUF348 domain-containing protein [Nocardioides jishulii]TKI64579.1 DUF348 domain-containing protein [Nocardioides jishulii]